MIKQVVPSSVPVRDESEVIGVFPRPMQVVCHKTLAAYRCRVGGTIGKFGALQASSVYEFVSRTRRVSECRSVWRDVLYASILVPFRVIIENSCVFQVGCET